jgi:CBS-domain-containing membrane protein
MGIELGLCRKDFFRGCAMQVEEILGRKGNQIFAVGPDWSVHEAVDMIAARNIGATLVVDSKGDLLGIISERQPALCILRCTAGSSKSVVADNLPPNIRQRLSKASYRCDLSQN